MMKFILKFMIIFGIVRATSRTLLAKEGKTMQLLLLIIVLCTSTVRAMELAAPAVAEKPFESTILFKENTQNHLAILDQFDESYFLANGILKEEDVQNIKTKKAHSFTSRRPIIHLQGKIDQNSNKYKDNAHKLEILKEMNVSCEGDISKIDAKLIDDHTLDVKLTVKGKEETIREEKKYLISLQNNAIGTCLAINPNHSEIYVGCKNGAIHIYDVRALESSEQKSSFKKALKHHTVGLMALKFHFDHSSLISKAEDKEICLWDITDLKPQLIIKPREHSKVYVTQGAIIQSHALKSLTSSLSSYFDADLVYTIPQLWLSGILPHNFSESYYIYQLRKIADLQKTTGEQIKSLEEKEKAELLQNNTKLLNTLYNMPIVKRFEPEVTEAFKKHIELHAERLGCKVQDTTFMKEQ